MKICSPVFRVAAAAGICFAAFCPSANAQDNSTTNTTATVAATNAPSRAPSLSFGVGEVLKMYKGGIDKDVILNFINNTSLPYHLTADNIIYLQTLGLPQDITKTMIQRDGQLQERQMAMQPYYQPQPPMPQQQPAPPPSPMAPQPSPQDGVAPSTPPPAVIGPDYPAYDYSYPYYDGWPYYYGGPVIIGGWGWGGRGFHGGGGFAGHGGGFGGHGGGFGGHGGGFGGHGGGHR
ncbi:MAG TPA: hypothetical protein VGO59_14600 [Verrucomicrobiae bacterium]